MTYDATILGLSPTNYYPTTETTGTTFTDSVSAENGTLVGTHAVLATTILGEKGVEFTNADTYVSASIGSIGVAGSWSCIIKVYSDTGNFAGVGYAAGGDNTPSDTGARNLGTLFGNAVYDSEGVGPGGGASMPAGEYHLVGTQASGGGQVLYVNGTSSATGSYTPGTASGGALYFPLGAFDTGVPHVAIGKVAFWDGVVLSSGNVAAMYAALGTSGGGGGGGGGGASATTRLSYAGGLSLGTSGDADFEPQVIDPPTPLPECVIAAQAITSVDIDGTDFKPQGPTVSRSWRRYRILVGGKDVTFFRGVQTPLPDYELMSPLGYGSGSLSFPQIHAALERPGHGSLAWLKKFAKVRVQRFSDAGTVIATDYVGFIADFEHDGRQFTATLGGEASGRAQLQDRPARIFPNVSDIGEQVMLMLRRGIAVRTTGSPTTGVLMQGSGGTGSQLDWLSEILAMSTMRDGTQWTVEPSANGYRMVQKDTTTIDATVYIDGSRVVESLKRDFAEEPNRIWAQGIDHDGKRVRFAVYPGLALSPRPAFPGTLSPGDSGDGVTAMAWRLYTVGYINDPPYGLVWTAGDDLTDAIEDLQDDAGLAVTGVVNLATWNAIFDPKVVGFTTRKSQIRPAAHKPYTDAFLRNATGQVVGRNPKFDGSKILVDASVDMGPGFTRRQIRKWAKRELADDNVSNWVGTLTINMGAVIDGEHNPGDSLTSSMLRDVRSLKPGMNLWLPNWDGGTLVHISGVNVSKPTGAGPVVAELAVDTRARDTMKVWEVIARNRESRKSPARQWIAQNRRSGMRDDTGAFYDGGSFGRIERTFCPADEWTVLATPAGRSGTLQTVDIQTEDDEALFGLAIFGEHVSSGWMNRNVGNPFSAGYIDHVRKHTKAWGDDKFLVDIWGDKDQPCGYWPQVLDPTAFNRVTQTGSVTAANDRFFVDTHGYHNGRKVYFAPGSVPAGLTANNDYYVIDATTNTFKVSATQGGSPMNITADHSGVAVSIHVADTPPVTGEFRFKAGAPYFCHGEPVLWIAVRPDRDCYVQGGRALELLLDDATS